MGRSISLWESEGSKPLRRGNSTGGVEGQSHAGHSYDQAPEEGKSDALPRKIAGKVGGLKNRL